jgi:hypothetical protein
VPTKNIQTNDNKKSLLTSNKNISNVNRKMPFYYYAASIFLFLSACEGGTTFTKSLDNKSSETITIKLFTKYGPTDEVTVNPNESKIVFWDDQERTFTDDSYTCTDLIDSTYVNISNGKTLLKNIMESNNWTRESKGGRNAKENCIFTITNSDLQ